MDMHSYPAEEMCLCQEHREPPPPPPGNPFLSESVKKCKGDRERDGLVSTEDKARYVCAKYARHPATCVGLTPAPGMQL